MSHTLLLADDSVTIQRVIQLTFAGENIAVVAVNDGDAAIASLGESRPDIVLADSGMPGRSGYDVARYIKSTPALADIPVLLLTGAFEAVDPAEVAEAGCDGFLAKPFEPQVVIDRVRELLAREAGFAARPRAGSVSTGATVTANETLLADVVAVDEPQSVSEVSPQNPAEMSASIDLSPGAVAPMMAEAVDQGFGAGEHAIARVGVGSGADAEKDGELDDYFDRLDRAIAERVSTYPARAAVPDQAPPATPEVYDAGPAEPAPEERQAERRDERPVLADAFSALLAAEESEAADPVAAIQSLLPPQPEPVPVAPPTIIVSEEIVEKVVRRVLEEMAATALRDAVAEVTSSTAERLILEEIERIKRNIK